METVVVDAPLFASSSTPRLRRVQMSDLTALKQIHDDCFPIVYPEEFYRKVMSPVWVAIVAVVPKESGEANGKEATPFGLGGFGITGTKIATTSSPATENQRQAATSKATYRYPAKDDYIVGFITGTAKILCHSVIPTPVAYISTFGVDAGVRKGGIGQMLLDAFLRVMRHQYDYKVLRVLQSWDGSPRALPDDHHLTHRIEEDRLFGGAEVKSEGACGGETNRYTDELSLLHPNRAKSELRRRRMQRLVKRENRDVTTHADDSSDDEDTFSTITSLSLLEVLKEVFFHRSPSAILAMGLVRFVAKCESFAFYLKGCCRSAASPTKASPPRHDQRITGMQTPHLHGAAQSSKHPIACKNNQGCGILSSIKRFFGSLGGGHEEDLTQVWLHVLATNTTAINFYLKRNFKIVKYLPKFYTFNDRDHDGIIMCCDISAEVQLGHPIAWDDVEQRAVGASEDKMGAAHHLMSVDYKPKNYCCSLFSTAELSATYPTPIQPTRKENRAAPHDVADGANGGVVLNRRTISPPNAATQDDCVTEEDAALSPPSITEHQLLVMNSKSTYANALFQYISSAPLGATFQSLDNIEESEQSNAVQWLVCAVCIFMTSLAGGGFYVFHVLSETFGGQQKGRRSLGGR